MYILEIRAKELPNIIEMNSETFKERFGFSPNEYLPDKILVFFQDEDDLPSKPIYVSHDFINKSSFYISFNKEIIIKYIHDADCDCETLLKK